MKVPVVDDEPVIFDPLVGEPGETAI